MRSNRPEPIKQMTDVLDEIIPAIAIDDRTSALVARIGECILKAAAEEQASYETLFGGRVSRTGRRNPHQSPAKSMTRAQATATPNVLGRLSLGQTMLALRLHCVEKRAEQHVGSQ
jgi:hypothetical protein